MLNETIKQNSAKAGQKPAQNHLREVSYENNFVRPVGYAMSVKRLLKKLGSSYTLILIS